MSLYEILGVEVEADSRDIRKAYQSLALQVQPLNLGQFQVNYAKPCWNLQKYHPDRHPSSSSSSNQDQFKRILHAYTILSDPKARQKYNQEFSKIIQQKQGPISHRVDLEDMTFCPAQGTQVLQFIKKYP
jgi:curved DNA-binding protein CbpA